MGDKLLRMRPLLCLTLLASLAGCPTGTKTHASLPACAKFGDNCEFSPGKLGSCIVKDGCTSGTAECFVCQSQH